MLVSRWVSGGIRRELQMSKVLIVHGISNQFGGEAELLAAWYPALCDGLARACIEVLPAQSDCFCPFYGDLFRPTGHLGSTGRVDIEDVAEASADEVKLLEAIWRLASDTDPDVPRPNEYGDTLFRAPQIAERALNSLAKSKYLARLFPLQFFGDLKQVVAYFGDPDIHRDISRRVLDRIGADTSEFIPLSFWYDAPLISRDSDRRHDHGWCTVHRATVPPNGVPGFHEPDARRVSATGPALRGRVPRPDGGMAARWETADGAPVYCL
jgi:hypothetical protein